ncbi:uncharacterized protein LOC127586491 [Pristis pectinata]|uniref:uncharacterized protein LOC127586491 n=1 Tax=Pristis pectinata TaxID=685728 RepID=UPI00223DFCFB|nr:uncharacterized protein LOC127586491 [Pristis pectinata]
MTLLQDKVAHRPRKGGCVPHPRRTEQEALELWRAGSRRREKQPAGAQPPQGPPRDWGPTGQETEGEQLPEGAAATTSGHSEPGASAGRGDQSAGSTRGESLSDGEQEPATGGWTVQEGGGRRRGPPCIPAEEGENGEFNSPAFRRRVFHVHHQLLEALDSLSTSCLALSQSTESAPTLAHLLLQALSSLQSLTEQAPSCVGAARRPCAQEPVAPALAPLIQDQTAALQGLVGEVSTGLERLRERLDGGFSRITHLLQSALPGSSGAAGSQRRGSRA